MRRCNVGRRRAATLTCAVQVGVVLCCALGAAPVHADPLAEAVQRGTDSRARERARAEEAEGVRLRRLGGWISLAAGVAVLLGAGTWWLLNESALDDAERRQEAASAAFAAGLPCGSGADMGSPESVACAAELEAANADVDRHRNLQTASVAVTGVGVTAAVIGAVLLLTADDSSYGGDSPGRSPDGFPEPWQITSQLAPDRVTVRLTARF